MGKKRGKSARKARCAAAGHAREEEMSKAPHSFIFHRGHAGKHMKELVRDVRKVMEPFTAAKLQVKKTNTLRDLTSVAGVLHVTHFMMFTKTDVAPYVRIMRLPRGPTLTFKIDEYCLGRDVVSSLRRPNVEQSAFQTHPLLVMNNFSGDQTEVKLMSTMFQNMFPSINVNKVKLNGIRRCVLINYNKDTKLLDFRHYLIQASPIGVSKSIKKLIRRKLPNMGRYAGFDEYVEKGGNFSESENEMDGPHNEVVLPQEVRGRGNVKSTQSAIRLKEIGPRMRLQLVKIEEGICDGVVMYHEFVQKSLEEQQSIAAMREHKRKLREKRKQQQLANVQRKKRLREEHREQSLQGMKPRKAAGGPSADTGAAADKSDEESDTEYFRQEVGANPDQELFPAKLHRKRKLQTSQESSNSSLPKIARKDSQHLQQSRRKYSQAAKRGTKAKSSSQSQKKSSMGKAPKLRFQKSGGTREEGKSRGPRSMKSRPLGRKSPKFQYKQQKRT